MNDLLFRRSMMSSANRPTTTLTFLIPANTEKEISINARTTNGWITHHIDWGDGTYDIRPTGATTKHTYSSADAEREVVVKIVGLLSYLNCTYQPLISLDVTQQPELKDLRCHDNQLTTLDVSQCPKLTTLVCAANKLETLDISHNTKLVNLNCNSNQLTSLDVSKAISLVSLECSNNQLTILDITHNVALTSLRCNSCLLSLLLIGELPKLKTIGCARNKLTALNVSQATALTTLDCSFNQITALDVSQQSDLEALNCYNNQLTTLDVSKNPKLSTFLCYNNKVFTEKIGGIDGFTCAIKQYQLWKSVGDYDLTGYTFDTETGDLALETDGVVKVNASVNRKKKYNVKWENGGINSWSIKAARVDVYFPDGEVISDKAAYYEKIAQIVQDEDLYEYPQLCKIHTPAFGLPLYLAGIVAE